MDIECLYQIILCQICFFQIYPKFVSSLKTSLNDATAYLGHILTDISMSACHIFLIPVLRLSECGTVAAHNSALKR